VKALDRTIESARCDTCGHRLFDSKDATVIIKCDKCGSENVFHIVTTVHGNFITPEGVVFVS